MVSASSQCGFAINELDAGEHPISRVVFESGLIRIGAFRCHPAHPLFPEAGQPDERCFFVFPRTAVEIQHEHEAPFVGNPNVVTFYNPGQVYRRNAISPEGDLCDWFEMDAELARDWIREHDPRIAEHAAGPFVRSHAWSDAGTYLLQRKLFHYVTSGAVTETLAVEETVMELLDRVTRSASPSPLAASLTRRQRDAVHDIEKVLSRPPEERLTLKGIARDVGLSPYHVCRLFRGATGKTLHHYRLQFRLRMALTQVLESSNPLTDVALDGGFSSHSHFTDRFRQAFGDTPSRLRTASIHPWTTRDNDCDRSIAQMDQNDAKPVGSLFLETRATHRHEQQNREGCN